MDCGRHHVDTGRILGRVAALLALLWGLSNPGGAVNAKVFFLSVFLPLDLTRGNAESRGSPYSLACILMPGDTTV